MEGNTPICVVEAPAFQTYVLCSPAATAMFTPDLNSIGTVVVLNGVVLVPMSNAAFVPVVLETWNEKCWSVDVPAGIANAQGVVVAAPVFIDRYSVLTPLIDR